MNEQIVRAWRHPEEVITPRSCWIHTLLHVNDCFQCMTDRYTWQVIWGNEFLARSVYGRMRVIDPTRVTVTVR